MIQEKLTRSSLYNYHTVYRPITVSVPKNMLIRADASPRDEIYRFIKTCVLVYLAKCGAWSYREEDIDELIANCLMHCYFLLVWRVKHGRYRKDLSFYLNVRSCAMSTVSSEYRSWLPRIKDKLNNVNIEQRVVGSDERGVRLIDTLSAKPAWRTSAEFKNKPKELPDVLTQRDANILRRVIDNDYYSYLDDCEEFGIDVLSIDEFIRNNYSDREYEIYHTDSSSTEYRRAYKAKCRDERRRKQIEVATRSNYAHYDIHKARCREAMRRLREKRKKTAK